MRTLKLKSRENSYIASGMGYIFLMLLATGVVGLFAPSELAIPFLLLILLAMPLGLSLVKVIFFRFTEDK
jgi:hypothetical protein